MFFNFSLHFFDLLTESLFVIAVGHFLNQIDQFLLEFFCLLNYFGFTFAIGISVELFDFSLEILDYIFQLSH